MKLRAKILIASGVILFLAILAPVIHHHQLQVALQNYISQIKAKGAPLKWSQVIPKRTPNLENGAPPVSNTLSFFFKEDNDASFYTNSVVFNNDPADMNMSFIPGRRIVGWRQPLIHDLSGNGPTNTWKELGAELNSITNQLNTLREMIGRPVLDFRLDYRKEAPEQHLAILLSGSKNAVVYLRASSLYNLHQGDSTAACQDIRAMLALIKGETMERLCICQLVRIALTQMSAGSTWAVLQSSNASDMCLAQLQQDWESLTFIKPMLASFQLERVRQLQFANQLRNTPTNVYDWVICQVLPQMGYEYKKSGKGASAKWSLVDESPFFKRIFHKLSIPFYEARWRWFWSYADEIRSLQMMQMGINALQMVETNHSFQKMQSLTKTNVMRLSYNFITNNPFAFLSRGYSVLPMLRKVMTIKTEQNIVITAIALKRYELQHDALPDKLDQLVPALLKSIPTDYMNGQPLHYRKKPDETFLLYSVGKNGKDDGGNPAWHTYSKYEEISDYYWVDPSALDWVWPQPATSLQARAYYQKQAKNLN